MIKNVTGCIHDRKVCSTCMVADDRAKRAYDTLKTIVAVTSWEERMAEPFVALRLSDGGSDGQRYATKQDAIRHQLWEQQCFYFCFSKDNPNGFASYKDAAIVLAFAEAAYDAGFRLVDPDDQRGGPELIMPSMNEHIQNQLSRLRN